MIGLQEAFVILIVLAVIAIFGRKTLKKIMRDLFSVKKDYEEIKKDFGKK